jgi:hypothetical protein
MIDIGLPSLTEHALDLTVEPTSFRTGPDAEPEPPSVLTGRVSFGGPLIAPITDQYVAGDPELAAFLAGEAGLATYHLVHAALTLHTSADQPPFESARVMAELTTVDGPEPPVAWSMRPLRLADTAEVTSGWRLGPKLELAGIGVEMGEVSETWTETVETLYLEAYGELGSRPEWLLHRTQNRPLRGSQRLIMVVRASPRGTSRLSVTVRTQVRDRQLLRYRTRDLDPLTIPATFP